MGYRKSKRKMNKKSKNRSNRSNPTRNHRFNKVNKSKIPKSRFKLNDVSILKEINLLILFDNNQTNN